MPEKKTPARRQALPPRSAHTTILDGNTVTQIDPRTGKPPEDPAPAAAKPKASGKTKAAGAKS